MIPSTPRFGNCLFGALWLRYKFGGRLRGLRLREGGPRHWICVQEDGTAWHFKRIRNVLPWPLCYTVFWGRYERLDDRKKAAERKQEVRQELRQEAA